jgi:uncharacterized Fe-S cluster-containing radical SAM superfamily protein
MNYNRYLTPTTEPYDALELAKETEKIVCINKARKYTAFYATGVYGGIATGYTVGCCLRCFFCWVDFSRDFPEKYGDFYSPEQAFENLKKAAYKYGVKKLRLSGAEPTLGKDHLLALLELIERSEFPLFILETNGILFGADRDYVAKVAKFTKPYVRISLKAGTSNDFTRKTGAKQENFELPFQAIKNLLDLNARFHVAAMTDKRIMSKRERDCLIKRLAEIDIILARSLEEEIVDPYKTTLARLKLAGVELSW